MDLVLTPAETEQFTKVLLNAFPAQGDLEQLVYFRLGQHLNQLTRGGTYRDMVKDLIIWANSQGQADKLLLQARDMNRGNPELRRFEERICKDHSPHISMSDTTAEPLQFVEQSDPVLILVSKYHEDIVVAKTAILAAQKLFSGGNIWPDQCEHIINSLDTLSEPFQKLCEFLDTPVNLPIVIGPNHYPVMKELHRVDELVNELILLLAAFIPHSRSSSKLAIIWRQDIERKLDYLIQSCKDLPRQIDVLLDQASFQEKKLDNQLEATLAEFQAKTLSAVKAHSSSLRLVKMDED